MTEEQIADLLRLLESSEGGASIAKAAKKLALGHSQLHRALTMLLRSEALDGLGFIEVRGDDPPRLHITAAGRRWLESR